MTSNMARMADIDWCQLVYTDLCDAAARWHKRNKTNITTTIYGCSLIVLIYYLDHLHHPAAPDNKYGTPRIKFFDNETIRQLARGDRRPPVKLVNHSDMQSFVAVQKRVTSLLQNGLLLPFSTYMCHVSTI